MCLVECGKITERVIADDIGVEDEERLVVLGEDLLGEFQGTCSA
jgi:hypothetical protein